MANSNKFRIPADKRGHRKRLADGEKSITYQIKLPESMHARVVKVGPNLVRSKLAEIHCV